MLAKSQVEYYLGLSNWTKNQRGEDLGRNTTGRVRGKAQLWVLDDRLGIDLAHDKRKCIPCWRFPCSPQRWSSSPSPPRSRLVKRRDDSAFMLRLPAALHVAPSMRVEFFPSFWFVCLCIFCTRAKRAKQISLVSFLLWPMDGLMLRTRSPRFVHRVARHHLPPLAIDHGSFLAP
jgi:hypothetical protein